MFLKTLQYVCLCICLLFAVHGVPPKNVANNKKLQESDKNEEWMRNIRDDVPILQITIPGAHDALARYWGPLVKCQRLNFEKQLMAGLRYFDLRVMNLPGRDLVLEHGRLIQFIKLGTIIEKAVHFLKSHPSEAILIRIKPEGPNKNAMYSKISVLLQREKNKEFLYTTNNDMNNNNQLLIGHVRGKIVVFNMDNKYEFGIDLDTTHVKGEHEVTDVDEKWNTIKKNLQKAKDHCTTGSGNAILVYSSGTGVGSSCTPITPKTLARQINPRLREELSRLHGEDRNACFGIIAMDFPDPDLIRQIIQLNESKFKNANSGSKGNRK